jgi:hypothetical protein
MIIFLVRMLIKSLIIIILKDCGAGDYEDLTSQNIKDIIIE